MQDTKKVTKTLVELYKENDWLMDLNFKALISFSGLTRLPRDIEVLDCGCATGQFLNLLSGNGFKRLYGVDASSEMVILARQHALAEVFCCDVLNLSEGLKGRSFDLITALNLQHHIGHEGEWEKFVGECSKALRPEGLLLIREPYPTFSFKILRWMAERKLFFKIKLLKKRLQSLVDEKELLYYFLDRWPQFYRDCFFRQQFKIIKDFCWMGHRIIVAKPKKEG